MYELTYIHISTYTHTHKNRYIKTYTTYILGMKFYHKREPEFEDDEDVGAGGGGSIRMGAVR